MSVFSMLFALLSPLSSPFQTDINKDNKKTAISVIAVKWWTIRGSNPGHPDSESGALPAELIVLIFQAALATACL